jgi:predicted metalloprotease
MDWKDQRESENVEDRRSLKTTGMVVGGGASLLVIILALIFGIDPNKLLDQGQGNAPGDPQEKAPVDPAQDELVRSVKLVLGSTEDVWTEQFKQMGKTYRKPTLVLFSEKVNSACGLADAAVGPFYCPGDEKVYLDLAFFEELRSRFKAPGEFAQAYVVAHEIGHHVQKLLGTSDKVQEARQQVDNVQANHLSVCLELQADFLAGVWAHHADQSKHMMEQGDLESALKAANAIGDDRLQKQARGYAVPDSFTHGTSAQRIRWFRRGFETGDIKQGDTFSAKEL